MRGFVALRCRRVDGPVTHRGRWATLTAAPEAVGDGPVWDGPVREGSVWNGSVGNGSIRNGSIWN